MKKRLNYPTILKIALCGMLIFPALANSQSLSSGAAAGTPTASVPEVLSVTSGVNTTNSIQVIYAYAKGGPYAPYGWFYTNINGYVCGQVVTRNRNVGPDGWHTLFSGTELFVPPGCTWQVTPAGNGYSRSWRVTRQTLGFE